MSSKPGITFDKLTELISRVAGREGELSLETVELCEGDVLFEQGQQGDDMFLVLSGKMGVRVRQPDGKEQVVNKLAAGSTVGEMALLSGQPRTATVFALEDTSLMRMTRKDIADLIEGGADLFGEISTVATKRWQGLQLVGALEELFGDLGAATWCDLQERLEWRHLTRGSVLFKQGDTAAGMYIVVLGRLRATITAADGSEQILGEIGPSEVVGEYALLTNEPRSATVYAVRDSYIAEMSTAMFDEFVREHPQCIRIIAGNIVARQKRLQLPKTLESDVCMTLALLPAGKTVDIVAFADELVASLTPYGTITILDSERFDRIFGRSDAAQSPIHAPFQPAIAAKLHELEEVNQYLLFLADSEASPWTQRAIGQADRVLIVAHSKGDPTPTKVERMLDELAVPVRTDLVLLHPTDSDSPSGTAKWLDARNVRTHYHVRQGDRSHVNRLIRRLTGRAIGLVFSGGSARGYAQMGVFKAMLELGIPIDFVGGTSMGAFMGSIIACDYSYQVYEDLAQRTADLGVLDYTLPFAALTASDHVTRICQHHDYGIHKIEDLWIPYFCVSTNLSQAEAVVHQRGLLWRAVRASISIPGVFLPVLMDGNVLVDGGIIDNYPVELMRLTAETNRIIGVNITPYQERKRRYDYDTSLSGWRVLVNRISPFAKNLRTPLITDVMTGALDVNRIRNSKEQEPLVELAITPDTGGFGGNEYDKWREIAQCGFDAAYEPLREWKIRQPDLAG